MLSLWTQRTKQSAAPMTFGIAIVQIVILVIFQLKSDSKRQQCYAGFCLMRLDKLLESCSKNRKALCRLVLASASSDTLEVTDFSLRCRFSQTRWLVWNEEIPALCLLVSVGDTSSRWLNVGQSLKGLIGNTTFLSVSTCLQWRSHEIMSVWSNIGYHPIKR